MCTPQSPQFASLAKFLGQSYHKMIIYLLIFMIIFFREETVLKNMSKMPQLIEQHKKMLKQKDSEVNKMSEKRERLLMEAREYFGYNIDPRDDKFKKMQEMKAEEYAKQKKLAKKQQKQLKIAADLEAQMKAATSKANEEQ